MSAGTGITHSEFNGSKTEPVHFLQIWIIPGVQGIAPSYEQKRYPREEMAGTLRLIANRSGSDGAVPVHQEVAIYAGAVSEGERVRARKSAGEGKRVSERV